MIGPYRYGWLRFRLARIAMLPIVWVFHLGRGVVLGARQAYAETCELIGGGERLDRLMRENRGRR